MTAWLALAFAAACWGQSAPAASRPARKSQVFLAPLSHFDYFWGGTREECLARGNRIISRAVEISRNHPEFRFLIEDNDFLANYMDTHLASREAEELKRLVQAGRIEIAPKWAAIYQNLPDGEAQVRNIAIGKRYARTVFGVDPRVAHLGDLPGYTPQFPQILAKTGVPYMVMTRMGPADAPLFHWRAPDGSPALVWASLKGYGWAGRFGLHSAIDDARREALHKDLEEIQATYSGPVYMSWGSDLWSPNEKIVENTAALNRAGGPARFILATPSEFFRRAAGGAGIGDRSGEIPSSWPNLLPSLANIWPRIVPATNALLNAEKFATVNYAMGFAEYPERELEMLWASFSKPWTTTRTARAASPATSARSRICSLPSCRAARSCGTASAGSPSA